MSEKQEKRGRGRPRKHLVQKEDTAPKRGRGRPRKHEIVESHVYVDAEGGKRVLSKPEIKKVDQLYLFEKVMQYLLKVQVVHNALCQANTSTKPVYQRLRELDLQMIEICQSVLGLDKAA